MSSLRHPRQSMLTRQSTFSSRIPCWTFSFVPVFFFQLMGIETSNDHGGAEMSFMAAIIAVEGQSLLSFILPPKPTHCRVCPHVHLLPFHSPIELAKVDPSVSVCCDVHNTLVNSVFRLYANDAIKDKYLPRLATDTVSGGGILFLRSRILVSEDPTSHPLLIRIIRNSSDLFVYLNLLLDRMHSLFKPLPNWINQVISTY